jgi:hypothetical protein
MQWEKGRQQFYGRHKFTSTAKLLLPSTWDATGTGNRSTFYSPSNGFVSFLSDAVCELFKISNTCTPSNVDEGFHNRKISSLILQALPH